VLQNSGLASRHEKSRTGSAPRKTKRPPGNWAAFSSRENSSNGGVQNPVKTFWRNLMSRKTGVSSDFYEINPFIFSYLQNKSLSLQGVPF
jgi:hypothetical protein